MEAHFHINADRPGERIHRNSSRIMPALPTFADIERFDQAVERERCAHEEWLARNPEKSLSLADNKRYAGRGVYLLQEAGESYAGCRGIVKEARRPLPKIYDSVMGWAWKPTQTELVIDVQMRDGGRVDLICGLWCVQFED